MGSAGDTGGGPSRPTNGTNSVTVESTGDSGSTAGGDSRPTVSDRVAEFREEYPDLADTRLSETDGRELRRAVTDSSSVAYNVEKKYGVGTETRYAEVERRAVLWWEAVEAFLDAHEEYRDARMRFGKGQKGRDKYESFEISLEDAWGRVYADKEYAKAKALEREIEREWGGDYTTVLLSLTASSTPNGTRLPPVDHMRAISDTWTETVYHALRNTMRSLGFDRDEWAYWVQGEPHPGDGPNACHDHRHVGIYVKGEVSAEAFHSVVDTHVEHCGPARAEAHDYETAISVNSDVDNLGSYMAAYAGVYGEELLERPIEYIAWGALHWATNSQRAHRSATANQAIEADACRQRYESRDASQSHAHGERLARNAGRGADVVCMECGSPWEVPDGATVTEARLSDPEPVETEPEPTDRETRLRGRWPSARAAVSVGETPTDRDRREAVVEYLERDSDASVAEVAGATGISPSRVETILHDHADDHGPPPAVSFERPPKWRAEAVIQGDGEEYRVKSQGGVDMVPLDLPTRDGKRLWERRSGIKFRCRMCSVATFDPLIMQRHAAGCMTEDHEHPSEVVKLEQVGGEPTEERSAPASDVAESADSHRLSQQERVDAVLSTVSGGASVADVVAAVDAPAEAVRATVETLTTDGTIYRDPDELLRPVS